MHLLAASSPADAAAWRVLIDRLPPSARDLHYLPGYCDVYARKRGGAAFCAVHEDASGFAIYPFVEIGDEIACAYGYGGPLASEGFEDRAAFAAEFADLMRKFCIKHEFCRLHPLLMDRQRPLAMLAQLVQEKPVVSIDLSGDIERGMSKGHRAAAARAEREGVAIASGLGPYQLVEVYDQQRLRKQWDDKWCIDESLVCDLIETAPGAIIFGAWYDDGLQAVCLLLHGFGICYYHYAASTDAHRNVGIGHLLVLEAARWAQQQGMREFYMGGGLTSAPDDSLLQFKRGFTRERRWLYKYERGF
jgi:GNAT superfamily N-acetyltransferase